MITEITGQTHVPFGDAVISLRDTVLGYEICEELWNPQSTHVDMAMDGVELIVNGWASLSVIANNYALNEF